MDFDSNWDCIWAIVIPLIPLAIVALGLIPSNPVTRSLTCERYPMNSKSVKYPRAVAIGAQQTIGGLDFTPLDASERIKAEREKFERRRAAWDDNRGFFPDDEGPEAEAYWSTHKQKHWGEKYGTAEEWQRGPKYGEPERKRRQRDWTWGENYQRDGEQRAQDQQYNARWTQANSEAYDTLRGAYEAMARDWAARQAQPDDTIDGEFYDASDEKAIQEWRAYDEVHRKGDQ